MAVFFLWEDSRSDNHNQILAKVEGILDTLGKIIVKVLKILDNVKIFASTIQDISQS